MALQNLLGDLALEASSQALLTELEKKADLTETQPVSLVSVPLPTGAATSAKQLADNHNVTVSNPPTGFATSANQLPDGHEVEVNNLPTEYPLPTSQVTTLTPPAAITGFATSAKQLADNHQVSVSNLSSVPVITGFATEAKQLADGHEVEVNNFPSEYPLSAAQVSTLTPPAAISGYALDTTMLALIDALMPLKRLASFMAAQTTIDGASRQRINVEVMPNVSLNNPTIANVLANGGVDPRYQFIDTARIAYNGIRQQITFTA